jgi:glycerol-3-phosphate dehydrogenase
VEASLKLDREQHWSRLERETFDLAVIGAGVVGAGVAWDAALRGYRVALVEQEDFAFGTSSRSSRMIHGGLRYLEYLHLGLVREASQERGVLLRLAPGLVRRTPFLIPFFQHDHPGPRVMNAGLSLYEFLGSVSRAQHHRMLPPQEALVRESVLLAGGLKGAARYYDALCDDARLVWAVVRAAAQAGAVVCNHARVVGLERDGRGEIAALSVHDQLRGRRAEVRAAVVVNAGGPWADEVRALDEPGARPLLRPTKGIHLVFRRERFPCTHAVVFSSPDDHRKLFLVPWGRFAYVGTTDTDFSGPLEEAFADAQDVAYMLEAMRASFREVQGAEADILSSWAGVRNLLRDDEERPGRVSREHRYVTSASGLLTVAGGKLTTFRSMAADVVDLASPRLPAPRRPCRTRGHAILPQAAVPEEGELEDDLMRQLLWSYGGEAWSVVRRALETPQLAKRMEPGLAYPWACVRHAVEEEMAQTIGDVLIRRTRVILESPDGGMHLAPRVGQMLARVLGWSSAEVERQVREYQHYVELSRAFARPMQSTLARVEEDA